MLQQGIIQYDDQTSWSSPLIVVRKAGNKIRLVNNYVKLNSQTIPEPYPMTNMSELLNRAAGSQTISRIDLNKAFL